MVEFGFRTREPWIDSSRPNRYLRKIAALNVSLLEYVYVAETVMQ